TTYELWPTAKQTLRIYQNNLTETGNWIGFRFREEGPGRSPIGLRMTVQSGKTQMVREIVTGDSYRSQHAPTVHFGLGTIDRIDQVLVRWPGGMTLTLTNPVLNSYHLLRPENRATISR
ncbi:MAG: ASPIC/UnbV domain-containing protein, partial [Verrucomicrobiota bacterium]